MTIEAVRKALNERPFRPFVLRTGDGREFRVGHPERLLVVGPGRTVIVGYEKEDFDIIDLLLVTSLHFAETKSGSNGNGRGSKGRERS